MGNTQAALQRRLGRMSMLIDQLAGRLPSDDELVIQMKKEMALIKEVSMRLVEVPHSPHLDGASAHSAVGR